MTVKGGPGQGATLALSFDTTISRIRTLQLPEWLSEAVDFSGLSDLVYLCFLPANLVDGGTFIAELYKNTEQVEVSMRTIQDATITLALQDTANTTAWSIVGSGFITSIARPRAVIGEPLIETITFKYDGNGTPPAVEPEQL